MQQGKGTCEMQLIKTPTKGMNDYLPRETRLREYVKSVIIRAYEKSGFSMIETPAVEHIENLTGKNGGDNEKLIFKIMKRGEKLNEAANGDAELCEVCAMTLPFRFQDIMPTIRQSCPRPLWRCR